MTFAEPKEGLVNKPTPDPTVLTTEALQREVKTLEDQAIERQRNTEREFGLRQDSRIREIEDLKTSIGNVRAFDKELFDTKLLVLLEKYNGQDRILALVEDQRRERKEDDRRALDAALAAAEKARVADTEASDRANTKTELSTAEQLKQQNATSNQANANTITLLNTLQTRVERIENAKQTTTEDKVDRRSNNGQMWAIVGISSGLLFGFLGTAVAVISFIVANKP